jgi:oxepin-CoA hydrolase/3-oxo-5,6-dehydrosuberyl-CoA semialdehyde dehydrogenase
MQKLKNYALGEWQAHKGEGIPQYNAITGEVISTCGNEGLSFSDMADYARKVGNKNLRKMTFQERGLMLKALALHMNNLRKKYYPISYLTGATKADSWIDIEGGIGTLFAYASLRRQFGNEPHFVEGDYAPLSKGGSFIGQHILVPKRGVAVHINAFNFPIWGMLEKCAVNWLAGMPAVVKPSEQTSFLTQAFVEDIINSNILPEGALQLVCGDGRGILDPLDAQDVITFTGSASTGRKLKAMPHIINNAIPFTMEADSLNACVLGEDSQPGTEEFNLFIKEVRREMTVKAGQKCTAIRRVIVPENLVEAVQDALTKQLAQTTIGNPNNKDVRMGAIINQHQIENVRRGIEALSQASDIVYGGLDGDFEVVDADRNKGAFMQPTLFLNSHPFENLASHDIEAFGPVSTIMPYKTMDEAIELVQLGKGSLVSSVVTNDDNIAKEFVIGAASHNGRILVLNRDAASESTGHGSPMPLLVHGGPGRAGGGEEMGGVRGVKHFMQRCAIQGSPTSITNVTGVFQPGSTYKESNIHPFRKHFEEIEIGDTVITHKHTVTEADITNFANVSGDNFYAHMDATSLEGTIFEQRVAHGYFVLSKAAGLFVEPRKGPVLLNYGIESCRFTKPVYPGMTIGVKFTAKEKIDQEKKDDIAKGIVKFLVDVYDETGETVAIATILTMVKKLNQD